MKKFGAKRQCKMSTSNTFSSKKIDKLLEIKIFSNFKKKSKNCYLSRFLEKFYRNNNDVRFAMGQKATFHCGKTPHVLDKGDENDEGSNRINR